MPARLAGNVNPARTNAFLRANSATTIAARDALEARRDAAPVRLLRPAALALSGCAGRAAAAAAADVCGRLLWDHDGRISAG